MATDFSKYGSTSQVTQTGNTDFSKYGSVSSVKPLEIQKEPNYIERVGSQYKKAGQDIISGIQTGAEQIQQGNILGGIRAGLRTVGGVAGSAFAPIMEAPIIKPLAEKIVGKVLENPEVKSVVTKATELAKQYPNASKDIQNIIDIATLGGGSVAEKPLIQEGKAITQDIAAGTKALLTPSEEAVQNKVISLFNKSIKPTAKKTITQGQKYENDTLNALKTIKANVNDLNIEDATGELISGRTPQTINELAQGLDQTKKLVFNQYDTLAKQAGTTGAVIDAKPIAEEVLKVAQNKALQITNPEVVKYAEQWAERLRNLDVLDTETTQAVIQNLNNNLQAFYKNPTYEAASKVAVDAGVVNNFRQALDKAIESATGEQYQLLKNQYSSLKAIENDVTRAAMRDARKNVKGLLDYTDIFTSGQMLGGILSLNPAMFTKGAVERGFKEWFKFLNDPNRAISNIFDKLNIETGTKFTPKSAVGKFIENPKLGMSIEDVTKRDNLLSEARKYKSAEEFVKAQGNPILHGTNKKFSEFDITKRGINEKDIPARESFFFTDSLDTAKSYGKNIQERYGNFKKPLTLDADGKMYGDMREELREVVLKAKKDGNDVVIVKNLSDRKDWGNYEPATHYAVLDTNSVLTKSQLIDIWNKANAQTKPLMEEARKYNSVEVRDKMGTKLQDPYTAEYLPTNQDGTITIYHSTTKEGAEKIRQSGIFGSKVEGGDIYFTTNKKGYGGIGKDKNVVLEFHIDPKKVKFDDIYRGEIHLKGNNTDIGGLKPVKKI